MPKVMEIIEKETKGKSYHTYKYSYDSIGLPSISRYQTWDLTVGVIQDYMVEAEKRMFAELVRDKRLGQDAYLPKDGSLEYKIMKSGREDLRTLQKIKHNYSWVIGVSKSFNPESCLDHTGKPNSNYIADLPVFQRFIIKPFYECLV